MLDGESALNDIMDSRISQLRHYLSRGWALVPLHDVSTGVCSCDLGAACRSAGKHPVAKQWQRPEHLVRNEGGLTAALSRWPSCNWGLATGLISGVWALDYDPKNVDPAQADEVARVLADCWAAATWVQQTGSGGWHFLFALPEDFVPNNGSGRLPRGFDVRGARRGESGGGQIVLAPSVSGVGPYTVLQDRPVTAAPAGVLDAVRPAPPRRPTSHTVFSGSTTDSAVGYVVAAVNGELEALRGCWTQRNQRAWRAAARCIEMINTGLVGAESVYAAWWSAGLAHPDPGVTVPDVELLRVWASAERHVGDRPADLSGVGGPSGWGGDVIHFAGAPGAPPLLGGGLGAGTGSYPQLRAHPVDNSASPNGSHETPPDPWEIEVRRQQLLISARREARRRLDDALITDRAAAVDAMFADLVDSAGLDDVPPLQPLIGGFLYRDTFARIIGASGSGKTFVALDMAAAVATGLPWCMRDTARGEVVYMVAEGFGGIRKRVRAWEQVHGTTMAGVRFLGVPVQATSAQWDIFVEVCRKIGPVLIVIDTQARVTVGVDENSATEMGVVVDAAERLRQATGACVLLVHHKGLNGEHGRGSTAVKAALQTELSVERDKVLITLATDKQKDDAPADPVAFRLSPIELDGTGETSASLQAIGAVGPKHVVSDGELMGQLATMASVASEVFGGSAGGTKAEFRHVVMTERAVTSAKSTFYRLWSQMISRKIIGKIHGTQSWRYIPPEQREQLIEPLPGGDPDHDGYYVP